jgi:hypothetical protein
MKKVLIVILLILMVGIPVYAQQTLLYSNGSNTISVTLNNTKAIVSYFGKTEEFTMMKYMPPTPLYTFFNKSRNTILTISLDGSSAALITGKPVKTYEFALVSGNPGSVNSGSGYSGSGRAQNQQSLCYACHGTGRCAVCGGSGVYSNYGYSSPCSACNGTGVCWHCHGSGIQ